MTGIETASGKMSGRQAAGISPVALGIYLRERYRLRLLSISVASAGNR